MSVRHDPLLCRALARELDDRHGGRRLRELRLDRDRRLALLRFRDGPGLLFLLHPEAGQILETAAAPDGARLELTGLGLETVRAPADERLLVLELPPAGPEGTPHRLVAELHTNQWNLLLLRGEPGNGDGTVEAGEDGARAAANGARPAEGREGRWIVRAALWPREPGDRVLRSGAAYRPPAGSRRWREEPPTAAAWRELLAGTPPADRRGALLREAAWISSVNVAWVLGEAGDADSDGRQGVAGDAPGDGADDVLEAARRRYLELRRDEPEAWLLERSWGLQPYVRPLGGDDARRMGSLLAAMAASLEAEEGWREFARTPGEDGGAPREPEPPELAELREALEARAARLHRRREALARELEEGPDPERLREAGNLILARLDRVGRGREEVELADFEGGTRVVELDPSVSPSENAERYYEEAARRERAREKIPREMARARETLERVESALEALEDRREPPDEAAADRLWELAGGRPGGEAAPGEEERLPYRVLVTSGGLEVRVGKGARSNEELTFHHSHTEDVWLHARQVPGAHVILRWHQREGNPPRKDLLEAAVAAAVHSDARHSGSVAVDWTRRKYVRSPRKSAPGAVIPRNVQTVFVKPDEAVVRRMRRRAEGG